MLSLRGACFSRRSNPICYCKEPENLEKDVAQIEGIVPLCGIYDFVAYLFHGYAPRNDSIFFSKGGSAGLYFLCIFCSYRSVIKVLMIEFLPFVVRAFQKFLTHSPTNANFIAQPPPGAIAALSVSTFVTSCFLITIGLGFIIASAPGPSAYMVAVYCRSSLKNSSGISSVLADSSVMLPMYQSSPLLRAIVM